MKDKKKFVNPKIMSKTKYHTAQSRPCAHNFSNCTYNLYVN
jgi:hypothetical protein